jgi:hypothetical protein
MNPFNQKTKNAGLIHFLGNRGHKYIDHFDPESEDESGSDSSDVSGFDSKFEDSSDASEDKKEANAFLRSVKDSIGSHKTKKMLKRAVKESVRRLGIPSGDEKTHRRFVIDSVDKQYRHKQTQRAELQLPYSPTIMAPTVKLGDNPEYEGDDEEDQEDERSPVKGFNNNLLIEDAFAKIHGDKMRQVVPTQHRKYLVYEEQADGSHKLQPNKTKTKRLSAKEVKENHPEFAGIDFVDTSGGAMFNSFGQTYTQGNKTLVVHSSQGNKHIFDLIKAPSFPRTPSSKRPTPQTPKSAPTPVSTRPNPRTPSTYGRVRQKKTKST